MFAGSIPAADQSNMLDNTVGGTSLCKRCILSFYTEPSVEVYKHGKCGDHILRRNNISLVRRKSNKWRLHWPSQKLRRLLHQLLGGCRLVAFVYCLLCFPGHGLGVLAGYEHDWLVGFA